MTLGSGSEPITIGAVVVDASGRPVAGLSKDDFTISEGGRPRDVVAFEAHGQRATRAVAPRSGRALSDRSPADPGRTFGMVFDDQGLGPATTAAARQALAPWIESLAPQDEVTVTTCAGDVVSSVALRDGRTDLLAALARLEGRGRPTSRANMSDWEAFQIVGRLHPSVRAGDTPESYPELVFDRVVQRWREMDLCRLEADAGVDECTQAVRARAQEVHLDWRRHFAAVLEAIERLSDGLAGSPERKAILLFSEGLIHEPEMDEAVHHAADAARRANAAVYFVAAGGLAPALAGQESRPPTLDDLALMIGEPALATTGGKRLSEATGGFMIQGGGDLAAQLARVSEDLSSDYLLQYSPDSSLDHQWHDVTLRVLRPDLTVRAHQGYVARPTDQPRLLAHEMTLWAALGSSRPPRDFRHSARVFTFEPRGREREALLVAEVPLSAVRLTPDEARECYRGRLAYLALIKDDAGRLVTRLAHEWTLDGSLDQSEARRIGQAVMRRTIRLAPGDYTLESAVLDEESGRLGVERVPFEVPGDDSGLALSSLAILERVEVSMPTALPEPDPLVINSTRMVPDTRAPSAQAGTGDLLFFVRVYPKPAAEPVQITLEVSKAGRLVASGRPDHLPPDQSGYLPWLGQITKHNLSAGRYVVRTTARQGDRVAEDRAEFEVLSAPDTGDLAVTPSVAFLDR